jgi:uncharacterized protein YllA (UPF0747 family)
MKAIGRVAGSTRDPRIFGATAPLSSSLLERARSRVRGSPLRGPLFERLAESEKRLGAPSGALERAREVVDGNGLVVLAGQQPALWGGPLYSLYKLLSAVEAASWLESEIGAPVLAIFWVVGDDADFGEVSSVWFPTSEGRIVKVRDDAPTPGGTRIGTLSSARQRVLLEAHAAAWEGHRRGAAVRRELEEALEAGTWSGVQAAVFHRLLPEAPFLVIDGGDPTLLEVAQGFLRTAHRQLVPELLGVGAAIARSLGFPPAFEPELATRALFRLEGDRRAPLAAAPGADDLLAPNVILRPALQDWILPNIATICGPSEIEYRAQLGPVYRALGVPEPIRLPRLHADLLPPVPPRPGSPMEGYEAVLEDPARWVDTRAGEALPAALMEDLAALREHLRWETSRLAQRARELDPSLAQLFDSAAGKADYQLDRLAQGIRGKARHRVLQSEPFLAGLSDFLRPTGRAQERILSLLTPFLCEEEAGSRLLAEAVTHREALLQTAGPVEERAILVLDGWVREGEEHR